MGHAPPFWSEISQISFHLFLQVSGSWDPGAGPVSGQGVTAACTPLSALMSPHTSVHAPVTVCKDKRVCAVALWRSWCRAESPGRPRTLAPSTPACFPSSPGTSKKGARAGARPGPSLPTRGSCVSKQSSAASPASVSLVSSRGQGGSCRCLVGRRRDRTRWMPAPAGQACRAGGPSSQRKPLPWVGGLGEAGWDCAPGGAASGPADARCGASRSWGTSQGTGQVDGQQDLPGAHRAHCPPHPHAPVPTQGWPPGTGTGVPQRPGRGRPVFSSQGGHSSTGERPAGAGRASGGWAGGTPRGGVPPRASPPTAQS